jgi:thioredoxin reductase (NADPH)
MAEQDLQSVAFPTLSENQLASLGHCPLCKLKHYRDGEILFAACARAWNFYIIKSGKVEIVDESADQPRTIVVHTAGQFTGEVGQLSAGGRAPVSAVARGECKAYEVSSDALRQILNDHPALGDLILQAFIARRQLLREPGTFTGMRVIGSRYSADTFRIRDFLSKNRVLFTWLDLEADPDVQQILAGFSVSPAETPVVAWGQRLLLRNPSNRELADVIGLRQPLAQTVYDLVVVGSGPAGLAAAVYGASEGLQTLVLDRSGPGGQAGLSMRIENYLGFPTGITGGELTDRAVVQANKFGARLSVPTPATGLRFDNGYSALALDGGETVTAKCVLIATGAEYRRLAAEGCERFEGRGVYYAATPLEAPLCHGETVIVVGGGNSAGQAAVYLSGLARKVYLLVRGDNLYLGMSSYLAQRIEQISNIEIRLHTEVRRMQGDRHLGEVETVNKESGAPQVLPAAALFSFIGAVPRTDWLPAEIARDSKGFVRTGPSLMQSGHWSGQRPPFLLETSHPGVFAAGDVRSGSVKRVASAVGEGSMAVQFVHEYLKEM